MTDNLKLPTPNPKEGDGCFEKLFPKAGPHPPDPIEMNQFGLSLTIASSEEHSPPAHLLTSDIDLKNFDLKSDEITSLMAEKMPSAESEDNIGSFDVLHLDNADFLTVSKENPASDIPRMSEDTLQSWLADDSDASTVSSRGEPLTPLNDESDMEEFDDQKENLIANEAKIPKEDSFVTDLINFSESHEKINEETAAMGERNLLDVAIESAISLANVSLMDVIIEPIQNPINITNDVDNEMKHPESENELISRVSNPNANEEIVNFATDFIERLLNKAFLRKRYELCQANLIADMKSIDEELRDKAEEKLLKKSANLTADMKSIDEELRDKAEEKLLKKSVPSWLSEIGLPKINISDAKRIPKDESFMKNVKKIGVYSHKLQNTFSEPSIYGEVEEVRDGTVETTQAADDPQQRDEETASNEYKDVDLIAGTTPNNREETQTESKNEISAEMNCTPENRKNEKILEESVGDTSTENPVDNSVQTINYTEELSAAVFKPIPKKHVTFADKKGDHGMDNAIFHQESPKTEETQPDFDTSLRFMTETYPPHEDEDMLSESISALLDPSALAEPRTRTKSSSEQEISVEVMLLEGEEQPQTERSGLDSTLKTSTPKSKGKLSKFMKCVKKKMWS